LSENKKAASKRYLVGIGNYHAGDDGLGLRLVEYLSQKDLPQNLELVEIAGNGLDLLEYFCATTEKMLWVDAALMGKAPGEVCFFHPGSVESRKYLAGRSTHEGDLLGVLGLAERLSLPVPPIEIMGIEPFSLRSGDELHPYFSERLDSLAHLAYERILGAS